MVAVNKIVEPAVAAAGAMRVAIVAIPMTCRGIFSLLDKNAASPLYCAVMLWVPASAKLALTAAAPLTSGAAPKLLDPSKNVTVPVGDPGLPGPAATVAVIVTLVSVMASGADTLVTLTKPGVIPQGAFKAPAVANRCTKLPSMSKMLTMPFPAPTTGSCLAASCNAYVTKTWLPIT